MGHVMIPNAEQLEKAKAELEDRSFKVIVKLHEFEHVEFCLSASLNFSNVHRGFTRLYWRWCQDEYNWSYLCLS